MDLFRALRESHDLQRSLCRRVLRVADPRERELAFVQLKLELAAHAAAEERFLYVPLLMTDAGLASSRHALAEHHEIEELCEDLSRPDKSTPSWKKEARALSEEVHHHLREEETKFFKVAGRLLGARRKSALAKRYLRDLIHMRKSLSAQYGSVVVGASGNLTPARGRANKR